MLGRQSIDRDLGEFLGQGDEGAPQFRRLEGRDQDVAGADLRLAEQERGVVPAAVEEVDQGVGDGGHLGDVAPEGGDRRVEIGQQLAAIELVGVGGKAEIGAVALQEVEEPVRRLDRAVARALAWRIAWKNASYPTRLSLPATVSRVISAIAVSWACGGGEGIGGALRPLGRIEARVPAVGIRMVLVPGGRSRAGAGRLREPGRVAEPGSVPVAPRVSRNGTRARFCSASSTSQSSSLPR